MLLIFPLMAGSDGTAFIKGKSGTGRTQLELHTSDIGNGVTYLKFTIDGKSYAFNILEDRESDGYVIHDHKNKVYTVFVDNTKIDFKFWMISNKQKNQSKKAPLRSGKLRPMLRPLILGS
jgi:hypothetical protein